MLFVLRLHVSATNHNSPPAKPQNLPAAAGNRQAALSWTELFDTSITKYEYLRIMTGAKLRASGAAGADQFGYSVAVDSNTMVWGRRMTTMEIRPTPARPTCSREIRRECGRRWPS